MAGMASGRPGLRATHCTSIHFGLALLLAFSCAALPAQWDRKGAQDALVQARKMSEALANAPSPSLNGYIRCIRAYQKVYLLDPHYGGSDDAIYEEASLYQEMGERFGTLLYYKNAGKLYRFLLRDYRDSPHCPDALLRLGDLCAGPLEDEEGAQQAYHQLQTRYKSSKAAEALILKRSTPDTTSPANVSPASGTQPEATTGMAAVQNIRHWSTSDYTRVIIDMDVETRYAKTRLSNPDRIFFDISNARLSHDLMNKTFVVGDALLRQVRVAQNQRDVVRVVLDFANIGEYSVFELHDPFRIVVDIHATRVAETGSQKAVSPKTPTSEPRASPVGTDTSSSHDRSAVSVPTAEYAPPEKGARPLVAQPAPGGSENTRVASTAAAKEGERELITPSTMKEHKAPESKPMPDKPVEGKRAAGEKAAEMSVQGEAPVVHAQDLPSAPSLSPRSTETAPGSESATASKPGRQFPPVVSPAPLPLPKAANPTSRGDRTLTRMLGLKIGRIVLDPGHGGHDTGTIGPGGMLEKDLVLQVARQLKTLLENKLGAEVVLTRENDTFISLEERTAVANQVRADLFLSIHANSSRSRAISGVETYYLNFARTDAEREVAARENATTVRNVSDLQNLIRKIAQADKSAESRELAAIVQKKLYGGARQLFPSARNRGVRRAPFVVLIGANMPSVLAEVAFISNPRDEKVLKQENNRQRLAQALFAGIEGYMKTLGSDVAQNHTSGE